MYQTELSIAALAQYPIKSFGGSATTTARLRPFGLAHSRIFMLVDSEGRFLNLRGGPKNRAHRFPVDLARLATYRVRETVNDTFVITNDDEGGRLQQHRWEIPASYDRAAHPEPIQIFSHTAYGVHLGSDIDKRFTEEIGFPVRLLRLYEESPGTMCPEYCAPGSQNQIGFHDGAALSVVSTGSLRVAGMLGTNEPLDPRRIRVDIIIDGPPLIENYIRSLEVPGAEIHLVSGSTRCIAIEVDPDRGSRGVGTLTGIKQVSFGSRLWYDAEGREHTFVEDGRSEGNKTIITQNGNVVRCDDDIELSVGQSILCHVAETPNVLMTEKAVEGITARAHTLGLEPFAP